jgi:hypothetical protein
MEDNKIQGGATIWARQTIESDIFRIKNSDWFKIWFYIVSKVNHEDNKWFPRGSNFFKYKEIEMETGATRGQIDHCIRWLKQATMIATQKTTRGLVITVIKYDYFQNLDNYRMGTKATQSAINPRQTRDTINNNDNNDNNKHTGENPEKAMYNYEPIDEFGNPFKRKMKKISKKENDELISVGLLWRDMAAKALKMPQDEIIMLNLYFPLRKAFDREGWHFKAFQELFQYFFNDPNIKYEDKLSFDLCLSQKYIAKYKLAKKKKELISTNASVSTDIKL